MAFVRLNKLLSDRAICSRREADRLITRGVVRVDGSVASLGLRVRPDAVVMIDEAALWRRLTIALHKPYSFVSQASQPKPRQRFAYELLTWQNQQRGSTHDGAEPIRLRKLGCCGRLDADSTGLLIFSQDGVVAKKIIGQASSVEKRYIVDVRRIHIAPGPTNLARRQTHIVSGPVNIGMGAPVWADEACYRLRAINTLDGYRLRPVSVEVVHIGPRPAHISAEPIDIVSGSHIGQQRVSRDGTARLAFTLREGRFRQIRRMCDAAGLEVLALKRVSIGGLDLGSLRSGQWRVLSSDEVQRLCAPHNSTMK